MSNTTKTMFLAGLLLVGAVAIFMPIAVAQVPATPATGATVAVKIAPIDGAIKPLSGFQTTKIEVIYNYASSGASAVSTVVRLKVVDAPSWAVVSVSPSTLYMPVLSGTAPGASQSVTQNANLIVSTLADAPAFSPATVKVVATAEPNGSVPGNVGEDVTPIAADFFSIIDAQTTQPIQTARPQQQVQYPVTITNFGNAQTKVFFDIVSAPDGWNVIPPQPTILESKQAGGKVTQATVFLTIQTPYKNGYLNTVGAVTMKISSKYALDAKQVGDSSQVSVLTTAKGFYVPGPDLTFLFVGVGIAAVALAGKRRRST